MRLGRPLSKPRRYVKPVRTLGNNAIHAIERAISWGARMRLFPGPFKPCPGERAGIVVCLYCMGRTDYAYGEDFICKP